MTCTGEPLIPSAAPIPDPNDERQTTNDKENIIPTATLFSELLDQSHRAAPETIWAQLRADPVSEQNDGTWVVTSYEAVRALTADPRVSAAARFTEEGAHGDAAGSKNFVIEDPPEHTRDRASVMKHFGPPHRPGFVASLESAITRYTGAALDELRGRRRLDVVADFAYPLPVRVICDVLGVPPEDEPSFSVWSAALSMLGAPEAQGDPDVLARGAEAGQAAGEYMGALIQRRKTDPGNDMISDMVQDTSADRLSDEQIISNSIILLIGGHETTVNAVTSGILLFLRNPEQADRVRRNPALMPGAFEEILRLEPPIQFRDRTALSDIAIAGKTIPKGATLQLSYAAANRDPARFADPDRFDPERVDNQHLAFNTGLHYCFGAPLARLEGIIALNAWLARVHNPRLVQDPPPYRSNPALRGPSELLVDFDSIG
ncbi:cytochrome P450 [Microbacteriaceae bacterium VKM Ac-2855]|nr:cytochrome P450 [Microbacteriaceae bacterium VKM Ac-2855]